MRFPSSFLQIGLLAACQLQHVIGVPFPQAATSSSNLVEDFSKAPAPTVDIGGQGEFVSIDPATNLFKIDGKTQYFAGTNTWWLSFTKAKADVDKVLKEVKESGLKVTRVWAFGNVNDASSAQNNYFQVLKDGKQSLNFDPTNGIPILDYVVSQAEKQGIKLILPLLNGNEDLGGINTYVTAYNTGTQTAFYTHAAGQKAFLNYVSFIVNRYKASPAVFSWEICNEPQVTDPKIGQCDEKCDTSVITKWATIVSKHIKSLDSKHLVSLGDEGWFAGGQPPKGASSAYPYGGPKGINFTANLAIKDIDFGTFHMYPNVFKGGDGDAFISAHADAGKTANKPVIVEEYGASKNEGAEGQARIMQGWQRTMVAKEGKEGLAGDLFWQFDEVLTGLGAPGDEYSLRYDAVKGSGSVFDKVVRGHAKAVSGN